MSTRSNICIKRKDGTFEKIYCHSDGYLEYNGQVLYKYYKDVNKINNLIELGDLSLLGLRVYPDPSIVHSFEYIERQKNVTVAYGRDRNEKNIDKQVFETEEDFNDSFNDTWCEYAYLYDENKKEWLYSTIPFSSNENLDFHPLKDKLEDLGLIEPLDEKLDLIIRQEMKFIKDYDLYEYKDAYESDEDFYFETEELLSTENGVKNYINTNKECLDSLEENLEDDNIKQVFNEGLKINSLLREYKKEKFLEKKQEQSLDIS